jgi:hypothetical protein
MDALIGKRVIENFIYYYIDLFNNFLITDQIPNCCIMISKNIWGNLY